MKKLTLLSLFSFLIITSWNAFSQQKYHEHIKPAVTLTITAKPDSICPGDTAKLTVSGASGTYLWSNGATTSTIYVTPFTTTTYSVTVFDTTFYRDSITVVVIPLEKPIITGSSFECKGHKDTLAVCCGSSYLWSNGDTTNIYITGPIDADSVIYVTVRNQLGCAVRDSFLITMRICTGIDEIYNSSQFHIFPNPCNGQFTIESSVEISNSLIEIYNVLGERVYSTTLNLRQGGQFNINIGNPSAGVYFYRIHSADGRLMDEGKVLIE